MTSLSGAPPLAKHGYAWWRSLGSPRLVAAPMVDQSELAFRMLTREFGATLCVTPMIHSRLSLENPNYLRQDNIFTTCAADRPLLAQFCGNDAATLLAAAKLVEDEVDGIDLNLGCPQGIAKRGRYGAFLLEETDLLVNIVSTLHKGLKVPITCKIRVLPTVERTIALAKALEAAGASLLTVHGRTKEEKKQGITEADWSIIQKVKNAVSIPVVANGGISTYSDIELCLKATGCDGVMTSEALLENPGMLSNNYAVKGPLSCSSWVINEGQDDDECDLITPKTVILNTDSTSSMSESIPIKRVQRSSQFALAKRYLELAKEHKAGWSAIKPHIFKILFGALRVFPDLRSRLGERMTSIDAIQAVVRDMEDKYKALMSQYKHQNDTTLTTKFQIISPLRSVSSELSMLKAQLNAKRESDPSCAWTDPEYLFDPAYGGAWYMRHRPDAYNGRKPPAANEYERFDHQERQKEKATSQEHQNEGNNLVASMKRKRNADNSGEIE
jgi:tRNA-dihydrouridine synthase